MRCVLQQSARTENPGSRKLPRNCCITRSHDVFHRKEFLALAEKRKLDIHPRNAAATNALLEKVIGASPEFVAQVMKAVE